MMINLEAPEGPPIMQAIKLGAMAMHLVTRFRSHSLIFNSMNPCASNKIFHKFC